MSLVGNINHRLLYLFPGLPRLQKTQARNDKKITSNHSQQYTLHSK